MKLTIVSLVVYLPTNLTLNDMQMSEYDITNEIDEPVVIYIGKGI